MWWLHPPNLLSRYIVGLVELAVCQIDQNLCENCAVKGAFTVNYWDFARLWRFVFEINLCGKVLGVPTDFTRKTFLSLHSLSVFLLVPSLRKWLRFNCFYRGESFSRRNHLRACPKSRHMIRNNRPAWIMPIISDCFHCDSATGRTTHQNTIIYPFLLSNPVYSP